jgi:hypothetical protein
MTFPALMGRPNSNAPRPMVLAVPFKKTTLVRNDVVWLRCDFVLDESLMQPQMMIVHGRAAKAHYGGGQNSINIESSVWAANNVDAVLTLTDCLLDNEPCRVTCNANCTCTVVDTNEPCTAGVSLAPTPVPIAGPTAAKVCPNITNVQHCPELMQNKLPAGNEGLFDCYNFCGGSFVSACSEGKCGPAECPEAGEAGSLMGVVTGYTTEHLNVQLAKPTKPASSAAAPSMVLSSFALLAALTFVTIC